MFDISLSRVAALDNQIAAYPADLLVALGKSAEQLGSELLNKITTEKLTGEALASKSGALAASIFTDVTIGSEGVTVTAASAGIAYAAIQEYGGKTVPHEILPSKASALAFIASGGLRFARRVEHPGSVIPSRSYLRSSLSELGDEIEARFEAAATDAWSNS